MAIVATHVAAVQELYVAYFGRPADPAGLDYWTNIVEAQGSTAAVSATFAASPEYIVSYFGKTNGQIVDQIYTNLFGRTADTAGRAYWVNLLNNGTIKVDTIVAEVAAAALTTDAEIIENKVAAATAFTAAVDTDAEIAGYNGTAAVTLAKAFITGVTTDASLATAIATANLNAKVAEVVKAGTPFTVTAGLAAYETAQDNLADFVEEHDGATSVTLTADVDAAVGVVDGLVAGTYTGAAAGVQAALLAEQVRLNNVALTTANTELTNANAAAAAVSSALVAAIANKRSATVANEEAIEAAAASQVELDVAQASLNARVGGTLDVTPVAAPATGTTPVVTFENTDGDTVNLISINARGNLVLATGVTEADYPGVTALRDALATDIAADVDAGLAATALTQASNEPVLTANAAVVTRVETAVTGVENAQTAIETLTDAVADLTEARADLAEFNALTKAVTDAGAAFTAAGYVAPKFLEVDGPQAATSGSDIFVLGDADTVSITSFGRSGSDSLFIGSQFTLNTGDLDAGNDAVMEVFFIQNGTRTEVHVEQAAYGSDSGAVSVITLIGVDADDLQLSNGIISLKAPTA
ncbi:DUF4214 domain-containing protein [Massilia timonae]|uniref:DUF4214 domain-containing protein n=1 Tax=Massilia timonae TaxID=47229 RepID=A0A1S2NG15_9BURK|nr:DUF4214 domain-containing protein [Massilia timonae]OIJ43978.1 hypothetical protein LO55_2201 [Massilia timonae]